MSFQLKSVAAALAMMGLACGSAHAWVVVETGTVGYGYSNNNYFQTTSGSGYEDLTGQAFTLSMTVDPTAYTGQASDSYVHYGYWGSVPFSYSLTINGIADTFNGTTYYYDGESYLSNGSYYSPEIFQYSYGYNGVNQTGGARAAVSGPSSSLSPSLDFNQVYSYSPTANDYQLANVSDPNAYIYTGGGAYNDLGTISNISINPQDSGTVPEPGSLALIGISLIGFVGAHRRKIK